MLVLKRKQGQEIWVDGIIKFIILHAGKNIKIGVVAPENMSIQRAELLTKEEINNNKYFMKDQASKKRS